MYNFIHTFVVDIEYMTYVIFHVGKCGHPGIKAWSLAMLGWAGKGSTIAIVNWQNFADSDVLYGWPLNQTLSDK